MNLKFNALEIEGFKTFTRGVVHIDLAARGNGLHFVRGKNKIHPELGPNDVAKTSLWDALSWCLFGRTPGGLRSTDIVPWKTKIVPRVAVTLGKRRITRTSKTLMIDDRKVSQDKVDELVGLPFDAFMNTILLGQGQPLFFDRSPTEKMALFGRVLPLVRWDERSKKASALSAKYEDSINTNTTQKMALEGRRMQINTMIVNSTRDSERWESARANDEKAARVDLKALDKELEQVTRKRNDADLAFDSASTELRATQREFRRVNSEYQHALAKEFQLRDALQSPSKCPTCGQPIKKHTEHQRDLKREYSKAEKIKVETLARCQRLEQDEKQFQSMADEAQTYLDRYNREVGALTVRIEQAKKALGERERNPYKQQLITLKKELGVVDEEMRDLARRERIWRRKQARAEFWVKGFKDVKLYEIDGVLQELELVTNAMLDDVGLINWRVIFDIEKETKSGTVQRGLNVSILSPHNTKPVKWESWGGGVGQRLRIIGALALSEVLLNYAGVMPSLEILDEPTQHLSGEGVRDLVDYLSDRAHRLQRQVWFIDHRVIESDRFASTLTVCRDRKGSYVL